MNICYFCLLFFGFFKKRKPQIYFFNIWKKTLWRKIHLHITLSQLLCLQPSKNLSTTYFHYTHTPMSTKNTHINFHLLWHWTFSTREHILCFLFAFIKHMQYKKSSLFVDINNFSKTKGLSWNQPLNKNLNNGKG